MESNRVMFIVLDGAPFDLLFSLAQKSILPTFRKLMDRGCFNLLYSTKPPISPVAMPSLFTGKNPGKHGMFGFGRVEKGVFKPYISSNMPNNTLWDILSNMNKKVILLNVPWTFPPYKVNGIMISGPPTPRNQAKSYPPYFLGILKSKIGQYFPDMHSTGVDTIGLPEKKFLEEAYLVTRKRAEALYYLMENYEWDLFLAVFTCLDRVEHVFFGYFEKESPLFNSEKRGYLVDYLKEIDSIVGKVVSFLNESDYLIIASDHGFEYMHKYVGINALLARAGFAKKRSSSYIFTIEKLLNFVSKMRIRHVEKKIPWKIAHAAMKIVPQEIDFSRSSAFGIPGGYVSINKKILKKAADYEIVKEKLISFFHSINDESSGEKIVEEIYGTREIYFGDYLDDAPDLVLAFKRGYEPVLWNNPIIETVKPPKNRIVRTGTHVGLLARRGILIVLGNGIRRKFSIEANIIDVTPTILHILGIPIPNDMDGRVLREIFRPETKFFQKPGAYRESSFEERKSNSHISEKEEAEVMERLRRLGYMR